MIGYYFDTAFNSVSGRPIEGVRVSVLTPAGTLAELFSDTGGTPLANPVVSNDNGLYGFYAESGEYKLELRVADTLYLAIPSINVAVSAADLSRPSGSSLVGYAETGETLPLRTVQDRLRDEPASVIGFRRPTDPDWTLAFQRAAATGRDILVPRRTDLYIIRDTIVLNGGQSILGQGKRESVIAVDGGFNLSARGIIEIRDSSDEAGSGLIGLTIRCGQVSNPASRAELIQYPPAIYMADVSRCKLDDLRITNAWVGINADGNTGGMDVGTLEISAYSVGMAIGGTMGDGRAVPGALDYVTIGKFASWPHELTPAQYALYADGQTIGLRAGRVEALNITHRENFQTRDIIGTTDGVPGFGSIGLSLDAAHARLDFQAGDYTLPYWYKTTDLATDYGIFQTGGKLNAGPGWVNANATGTTALVQLAGGDLSLSALSARSGSPDAPIIRQTGGTSTIIAPSFRFGGGVNRTRGYIRKEAGRMTLLDPRFADSGNATGAAIEILSDDWDVIRAAALLDWDVVLPAQQTVGTYQIGAGTATVTGQQVRAALGYDPVAPAMLGGYVARIPTPASGDIGAAMATAAVNARGIVVSGVLNLESYPTLGNTGVFALGPTLAGAQANYPGLVDLSAARVSPFIFSQQMSSEGNATVGSANQHGVHFSAQITVTNAAAGYQKNGGYFRVQQDDPTPYTSLGDGIVSPETTVTKDAVAAAHHISAGPNNTRARLFAMDNIVFFSPGTDGACAGAEFKIVNNGSAAPLMGTALSKHGVNFIADGPGMLTSALWFESTGVEGDGRAQWNYGLFASRKAIGKSLVTMRDDFRINGRTWYDVSRDGHVGIGTTAKTDALLHAYRPGGIARTVVETPGGAGTSAHRTVRRTGVMAYSEGIDGADSIWKLTSGEDLTAPILMAGLGNTGLAIGGQPQPQGQGNGATFIANVATVPSGNPLGGGFLFVEGGALKYRGSSGTVTTVAAA